MSVGTGRQNIIILFLETTVPFLGIHKWEPDIILDSHRPFICSAVQQTSSSSAFSSQIPVVILSGLSSDDRCVQIVLLTCKLNPFHTHSVVKVENNHAERTGCEGYCRPIFKIVSCISR